MMQLIFWAITFVIVAQLCWWDVRRLRLPNPLVAALALWFLLAGVFQVARGQATGASLGVALLVGVMTAGVLAGLAWWRPRQFGMGDAKIAGVLAGLLGWFGSEVAAAALFGVAGLTVFTLLLHHAGNQRISARANPPGPQGQRKQLPLGPALLLGVVGACFWWSAV